MPKRNGAQGSKERKDAKVVNGEEEVIVECSTSASQEFQDGSQHESEEGQEVRCRKRWADVESDDEEEHFPSFSGEKSFVAQKSMESADGKESTDQTAEDKEEEWQEVTAKKKQQKPFSQFAAPQEEPSSRTGREGGQRAARRGDNRRRKDKDGKDGKDGKDSKDGKDGKEKKEPRRRGGADRGQGNGEVRPRRGDGENNERKDNQPQRSSEKKEAPKEITWRKKSTEEVGQADKPKEVKEPEKAQMEANNQAELKTGEEAGRERIRDHGRNRRSKEEQRDSEPKQPRQNSGRNDGNRRGGGGRGERGGRRSGNGGNGGGGNGGNGSGNRNRGPTAEDWFASRMQAVG